MILRALTRLIGEVALWTGLLVVASGAVALGAHRLIGHGRGRVWRGVGAAVLGGMLFAGLADRLDLPQVIVIEVGRRPLPLAWVAAGALAGAALYWIRARRAHA